MLPYHEVNPADSTVNYYKTMFRYLLFFIKFSKFGIKFYFFERCKLSEGYPFFICRELTLGIVRPVFLKRTENSKPVYFSDTLCL
jgi:hypothetical protein